MSRVFDITPKKYFTEKQIINHIGKLHKGIRIEKRNKGYYFIWIEKESFRGIDLTFSKPFFKKWNIEIRNTVLSHPNTYELTNQIAQLIVDKTKGIIKNEEEEIVQLPLYDISKSEEMFIDDARLTLQLVNAIGDISIFGVYREIHFGKRMYQYFKPYLENDKILSEKMKAFLYKTQYEVPDFSYGNIMEAYHPEDVNHENPTLLKLVTNTQNTLIGKCDFIMLDRDIGNPVVITPDILYKILPDTWQFVDEYTVVAPMLPEKKWQSFIDEAEKYDKFDEMLNN